MISFIGTFVVFIYLWPLVYKRIVESVSKKSMDLNIFLALLRQIKLASGTMFLQPFFPLNGNTK